MRKLRACRETADHVFWRSVPELFLWFIRPSPPIENASLERIGAAVETGSFPVCAL
jgi:hypothetical protein